MGRARMSLIVVTVLLCTMAAVFARSGSGVLSVDWFTVDGGGGTSTAGSFQVTGTIGQPDAGSMSGGDFVVAGGFLPGQSPPCPTADLNGDCVVNGADLGHLLGAWGLCPEPCPPSCPADLNGDCAVFGADLGLLLGQWTG